MTAIDIDRLAAELMAHLEVVATAERSTLRLLSLPDEELSKALDGAAQFQVMMIEQPMTFEAVRAKARELLGPVRWR